MTNLAQRRILLGVTGGIAAYKAAELTRLLRRADADVRVVMTRSACDFVGPLTFQALSGNKVHTELLDADAEASMGHIELARWAEAVVVAPASADTLARLAQGRADDLLTTLCLATEAPLAVAPAMNHIMWANPAMRDNMAKLYERGVTVLGPDSGDQACGETGPGRMREPVDLLEDIANLFARPVLDGVRVMITAGPTHEPLDPVRYLGNNSSGRMGFALAAAARRAGARVTLVAGPVWQPTPAGVERVDVETAADMEAAVQQRIGQTDLFIACAAVAAPVLRRFRRRDRA
jgi:phosphopantothenoylcysteine decarboxylase/phosphopantothenate--cysteine ligase